MTTQTLRRGQTVPPRSLRIDTWWVQPLLVVVVLSGFIVYATWAGLQNANYYFDPYISPFYSPCLATNCTHVTLPLVGAWWTLSPAILILGVPAGFRTTCYYYRKAYYRSFFGSPPGCAVPDRGKKYQGETVFPYILQNVHRYFFWLSLVVLVFLWWDFFVAFRNHDGRFMIGLGTLVLGLNATLLTLYSISCHSCRHIFGGGINHFSRSPLKLNLWKRISQLNEKHQNFAWVSLFGVGLTDLYVRLLAMGVIQDPRWTF